MNRLAAARNYGTAFMARSVLDDYRLPIQILGREWDLMLRTKFR